MSPGDETKQVEKSLASAGAHGPHRRRLVALVGRLTLVNAATALVGLITGPLLARALGPDGRGTLAAILVPLGIAPIVANLGLNFYAVRESARGRPPALLIGSLAPVIIVLGAVTMLLAPVLSGLFAGDREVVYHYLTIGFLVLPLTLFGEILVSIAVGQERWRAYVGVRLIPPLILLVGLITLYVLDRLTIGGAATLTIVSATLAVVPVLPMVWAAGKPRFDFSVTRESVRFGFKAWVGGLGSAANVRLDQLLMIRLVEARELGLYVVAFTTAGILVTPVLGAITSGSFPRFSTADPMLIARVVRVTLLGVTAVSVSFAVMIPFLVPVVFGRTFDSAVPVAWILLAANIPFAGVTVLSAALTARGRPGSSAKAELLTLGVTVPGLLLLLPSLGGIGAALVSLVAYTLSFTFLLLAGRRYLEVSLTQLVVIRSSDVVRLIETARFRLRMRRWT